MTVKLFYTNKTDSNNIIIRYSRGTTSHLYYCHICSISLSHTNTWDSEAPAKYYVQPTINGCKYYSNWSQKSNRYVCILYYMVHMYYLRIHADHLQISCIYKVIATVLSADESLLYVCWVEHIFENRAFRVDILISAASKNSIYYSCSFGIKQTLEIR